MLQFMRSVRWLLFWLLLPSAAARELSGYVQTLQSETEAARAARHLRVAARRVGPAIIVHRGAHSFAPENTLEACAAAMDYGADGCEVDIRRTSDGVLALFHDDMLDQLTNGFGEVSQLTYYELLSLKPRFIYGTANAQTRPPTFAALLALARQGAMLLHLDVKEPNLDDELASLLESADAWDHVVAVNTQNAAKLAQHPKLKLLRYKGPGLYENRRDVDPESVNAQLARPGEMIMVDDPRVAARELKRPAYAPIPLPSGLRAPVSASSGAPNVFSPFHHVTGLGQRINPNSIGELMKLLKSNESERTRLDGDEAFQRHRTARIVERAWAAQRLGELKPEAKFIADALQELVRHRSLHKDWRYHGLDGAMAARALGMLGAKQSVPALVKTFERVDPELQKVVDPRFAANPLAWTDFRTKMYLLPALGELKCAASKAFLLKYLALEEAAARELAPLQFEAATKALLQQALSPMELRALLKHRHSAVRGTAILELLDHPTPGRTAALKAEVPWAFALPSAAMR